ncbi:BBP7 family outer membrane beta-barrel protein [Frigoriglobus tundricola]|nr:BBP7 family outer membrane beta-barrel protein [Frigoriglobus tundricola]
MSGPRLWATGDYLLMWYTPMRTVPLIQSVPSAQVNNSTLSGVTTIFPDNNNHINFGAFSGVRASVGANWDKFGVDVGGFVLERQTQSAAVFNDGTPFAIARGYTAAGATAPTSLLVSFPGQYSGGVAAAAQSQLWGAEANVRRAWYAFLSDSTDLILGFRYIDLNERLAIDSPSYFPNGNSLDVRDAIRTRNTFYGGQVGFASRIGGTERGLGFEFTTKSGLGGVAQRAELVGSNTVVAAGVADVQPGGLYVRGLNAGTFTRDKFAYMQDLGIRLTYNFNPWVQVSFGYSFLYLSSVMRPGKAIDPVVNDSNVRFVANPTPSDLPRPAFAWRAEELVVQGMTFGLRIQY